MDLVLLSGGHDSGNLVFSYRPKVCLFVDYGQPAMVRELIAARAICDRYDSELVIRRLDRLTTSDDVVAGRNLLLIATAVPVALDYGCNRILIGCTANDHNHFPDCRTEWVRLVSAVCQAAYQVKVEAPFKTRPSYVIDGSYSCYTGNKPCGECRSCKQTSG